MALMPIAASQCAPAAAAPDAADDAERQQAEAGRQHLEEAVAEVARDEDVAHEGRREAAPPPLVSRDYSERPPPAAPRLHARRRLGYHSRMYRSHSFARTLAAAALGVAAFAWGSAHAQDFPTRPVRIVVPFSPGGAVDGPTRVIAQELSKRWNVGVIVDNKPGAGATIGTEIVAKSPPDGYTLLLASQTNAISASIYKKLSYDPIEDFAPISLIGREPGVLVVNPSFPARTLAGVHRAT